MGDLTLDTGKFECTIVWPKGCAIRTGPSVNNRNHERNGYTVYMPKDIHFIGVELSRDSFEPDNSEKLWIRLSDEACVEWLGTETEAWIAVNYPGSGDSVRATYVKVVEPTEPDVTKIVVYYEDGSSRVFVEEAS